ncbi:hypothetical protein PFISCL1PPCAC_1294 [Pristionchus fissidentatus]|uniref:Uncharacterized protein n=1 Tax=Pristionchus fissidentatus TaxID=1538716 RepID=A0AAV5US82_9BILA|nr:hypothetical protein PFISCL1PPCAC_1294 [Pristionchus fissidentatus]
MRSLLLVFLLLSLLHVSTAFRGASRTFANNVHQTSSMQGSASGAFRSRRMPSFVIQPMDRDRRGIEDEYSF